ncbi:MAG: polysaccharide deacetylase family protein [Bacillota bacterium]|jgi:peptidoglycan/xylan/chitin deacetylase (PgdA/CDA1 family)
MRNNKCRKTSKLNLLRATTWGEFFLTIILVIFLFPSSQFLYANSEILPQKKVADVTHSHKDIVPEKPVASLPEVITEISKTKPKYEPEMSKTSETLESLESPEIPKTPEESNDSMAIKESGSEHIILGESSPVPETPTPENPSVLATVFRGNPQAGKKVAITIDDGPYAIWTAEYLKVLEEYQVPAVFFLVGSRVEKYPEIARKITEKGFEIGSHSYRHAKLTLLKREVLDEDFRKTVAAINLAAPVKYFRPPYGDYNQLVTDTSEKFGLKTIGWNVDPRDWATDDAEKVIQDVLSNVKDGSVILLHEGRKSTLVALPKIILGLKDMGYQIVSLSELMK